MLREYLSRDLMFSRRYSVDPDTDETFGIEASVNRDSGHVMVTGHFIDLPKYVEKIRRLFTRRIL